MRPDPRRGRRLGRGCGIPGPGYWLGRRSLYRPLRQFRPVLPAGVGDGAAQDLETKGWALYRPNNANYYWGG
jgi:hypothetical protein